MSTSPLNIIVLTTRPFRSTWAQKHCEQSSRGFMKYVQNTLNDYFCFMPKCILPFSCPELHLAEFIIVSLLWTKFWQWSLAMECTGCFELLSPQIQDQNFKPFCLCSPGFHKPALQWPCRKKNRNRLFRYCSTIILTE